MLISWCAAEQNGSAKTTAKFRRWENRLQLEAPRHRALLLQFYVERMAQPRKVASIAGRVCRHQL
jgi:hypothetical protein